MHEGSCRILGRERHTDSATFVEMIIMYTINVIDYTSTITLTSIKTIVVKIEK